LMTVPQAFVSNYWAFVALRFAVGLFVRGILPAANALIGKKTPAAERGAVYGMTSSAYFFGNSLGPVTGGTVAATFGLHWVFLVTALLLGLNLAWVYFGVHTPAKLQEEAR
jgi:DHA1 family multidrug resistance protein-like MFS transporter